MKKVLSLLVAFIALLFGFSVILSSCDKGDLADAEDAAIKNNTVIGNTGNCACIINPPATITPEEVEMLKYMREEEKLARDVYLTFSDQYNLAVFTNISNSEQRHMDRVLCLLTHYEIEDPASTEIGIFNNSELQNLYNDLIAQGSESLQDALTAGATIEDADIHDLEEYSAQTSNEAMLTIFGHLNCGSRNHLRAFSGLLADNGLDYTPQFISQEEYDEILAGSNEMCGYGNGNGGNGNGNGGNGNGGNGGNCNGGNGGNGNGGNCP